MLQRLQPVLLATAAVCASITAASRAAQSPFTLSLDQPQATDLAPGVAPNAPAAVPSRGPLMSVLDRAGVGQWLDEARLNVFGHIEGSYTYNFDAPAQNLNLGRVFDINHDRAEMNQLDLNIERRVDLAANHWDIGGRVEFLYGTDARFIHSSGFLDGQDFFHGPEYQFDIPQLYLDIDVPVGNGLRVRAGKFLFFKQIDPNASVFYSHSFTFGAALPFTLTGVTAYYPFSDRFSIEGGISRGWGQTFKDNNGAIDALGRARYTLDDRTDFSLAAIVGPELDHDNAHYRSVLDFTVTHALTQQVTLLLDAVYGYQAEPSSMRDSMWYGVSGYAVYQLNEYLALAARAEWYRDEEGFTTDISQTLLEGTVGVTVTPFPRDPVGRNLKVRPELRYDYSTRRFFDGLSRHDQATVAVDAYFDF